MPGFPNALNGFPDGMDKIAQSTWNAGIIRCSRNSQDNIIIIFFPILS